jgi:hypothetical protein
MFWALARVSIRAAKIVSCNKNFFFMVYDQNYHNCSTLCRGLIIYLFITLFFCFFQSNKVGEALRALGTNPTEAEVRRLVQDQKATDRISFETFLPILQVSYKCSTKIYFFR